MVMVVEAVGAREQRRRGIHVIIKCSTSADVLAHNGSSFSSSLWETPLGSKFFMVTSGRTIPGALSPSIHVVDKKPDCHVEKVTERKRIFFLFRKDLPTEDYDRPSVGSTSARFAVCSRQK
jgi:hypothetical protein